MVLVKDPMVPASLLVATAAEGLNAGKEMKPPPPTTESINAAKKPKRNKIIISEGSKSKNI